MRQRKWIVTWKVRGVTFHHECTSEESALSFSEIQRTISQKEKERFTQTKPARKRGITIRELFDHHFSLCSKRPVTIKQDVYHARPLLEFMGNRPVSSITQKEILTFCKSQKMSGMAQSTIHRRISLLRSVANWGKKKATYLQSLRTVLFQKEKLEELHRRVYQNLLRSCAWHPHMSSELYYSVSTLVPASARVNCFR